MTTSDSDNARAEPDAGAASSSAASTNAPASPVPVTPDVSAASVTATEYIRIPLAEYNKLRIAQQALSDALQRATRAETLLTNANLISTSRRAAVPVDTTQVFPGPVYPRPSTHRDGSTDIVFPSDENAQANEYPVDDEAHLVDDDGFPIAKPRKRRRPSTAESAEAAAAAVSATRLNVVTLGGPPQPLTRVHKNTQAVLNTTIQYGEMFRLAVENVTQKLGAAANMRHHLQLTPSQVQIIMEAIELGVSRAPAFAMAAISRHNYDSYVRRAKELAEPYCTLMSLIEIAEARCEAQLVGNVQLHSAEHWQASVALLTKRFADRWGDKRPISLNVKDLLAMSPEKLREILGDEIANEIESEYNDDD